MVIAILSFGALLGGWWLAAELDLAKDIFLPTPVDVWNAGVEAAKDGTLWDDAKASFIRITIGFSISTVLALPIGILIGTYRAAEAAVEPSVDFIRYMPAVAFVPLTIVWVGVDEPQKWLIIFIGTFFQQVLLVQDNVKRVPREFVDIGLHAGDEGPHRAAAGGPAGERAGDLGHAADHARLGLDLARGRRAGRRRPRASGTRSSSPSASSRPRRSSSGSSSSGCSA